MVSARTRRVSAAERGPAAAPAAERGSSRADASTSTGRMNSSDVTVSRKMQPNTAATLDSRADQSMRSVRGYSSS